MERSQFTNDQIIWSADVPREEIQAVIDAKILPEGTVIKLDRAFFATEDRSFIGYCQDHGYPVFCDVKIDEVPVKVLAIARAYLEYKPFMINVMGAALSNINFDNEANPEDMDALKRFTLDCNKAGTLSCVVTVLTSKTEKACQYEYGASSKYQVLKYVKAAHDAGMSDIVCSPKEAAFIREHKEYNDMWINTPGVRLPNSSSDDQARIMTPHDALNAGANRLVIGRDLIRGDKEISILTRVAENYEKILANINS